ncbi:MAG TPA: cupin domain-containing protein [Actinomycetota bacterium]
MTDADRYFTLDEDLQRAGEGRFLDLDGIEPAEFVPGLVFRPVLGDRVMVNWVHFDPNTEAPKHAHEEEQITFVVEGEFEFDLDGDVRVMKPGMVAVIPAGVPHGARTRDSSCLEIDVFVPPRKALLELTRD